MKSEDYKRVTMPTDEIRLEALVDAVEGKVILMEALGDDETANEGYRMACRDCARWVREALAERSMTTNYHAGKVREIVEQILAANTNLPQMVTELIIGEIDSFLDAECKAAVASALEQAANQLETAICDVPRVGDYTIGRCSGFVRAAELVRSFLPSPNYIALREAEARIDELQRIDDHTMGQGNDQVCLTCERIAALTEARDKLAKK